MKRSLRLVGLAAFVALPLCASSQDARPVTFGVSGGLSLPIGDLGDGYDAGYNGTGHIMFKPASFTNLGFRGDVNFDRFKAKSSNSAIIGNSDVTLRLIGGTANAIYSFPQSNPGVVRPYVLAGVGMQNSKSSVSVGSVSASGSSTDVHAQGGGGVNFQLASFSTFVEAKYVNVFGDGSSLSFIPITFGIRF